MGFPFGRDFTYQFFPLADDDAVLSLPTQSPTIYLFAHTSKPGYTEARNGTNAFATINTWTANQHSGFDISIPAIDDPAPTSSLLSYTYYIALNFVLTSSEQTQCVIRSLEMERVVGHHKRIAVTDVDLRSHWPALADYCSSTELNAYIELVRSAIREELRAEGYDWCMIYRPDRLYHACVYKCLDLACLSQLQSQGDKFDKLHDQFSGFYKQTIAGLKIEIDSNKDGIVDGTPQTGGWSFLAR